MTFTADRPGNAMRLLVRSPPHELEALSGYMLRLCHLNGYKKLTWAVGTFHASVRKNPRLTHILPLLANATGISIETLRRHAYNTPMGSLTSFKGHKFQSRFVNIQDPKVCPQCMKMSMVLPFYWDFELLRACPEHGIILVSKCPSCNERLSWGRSCIHRCKCGYDLRKSAQLAAPSPLIWYSAVLLSKLGIERPHRKCAASPQIANFTLNELFLLTVFFGGLSATSSARLSQYASERRSGDISTWVERTANILLGWPESFHVELERLRKNRGLSPRCAFRPMIAYLQNCQSSSFDFVIDEFRNFVEQQTQIRRFANPANGRGIVWHRSKASEMLGVGKKAVLQLVQDGVLQTEKYRAASRPLLTREHVEELLNRIEKIAIPAPISSFKLQGLILGAQLPGRYNVAKLLGMAFRGNLQIFLTDPDQRGLKRYSISETQLMEELTKEEIRNQDCLSSAAAKVILKCTDSQLHSLLEGSAIRTVFRKSGKGRKISKSDLIAFAETYLLCCILAKEFGVTTHTMKKIAEYLFIPWAHIPDANNVPLYWYKKDINSHYEQITLLVNLFKQHASQERPWDVIRNEANAILGDHRPAES